MCGSGRRGSSQCACVCRGGCMSVSVVLVVAVSGQLIWGEGCMQLYIDRCISLKIGCKNTLTLSHTHTHTPLTHTHTHT